MKKYFFFLLLLTFSLNSFSQSIEIHVQDASKKEALPGVSVALGNKTIGMTDSSGNFKYAAKPGTNRLRFSIIGYEPKTDSILIKGVEAVRITIELVALATQMEEITILASTRNNQRMENSPLKVEVLGREEMDEENTIKPASIASILGDLSGIQIQQTSQVSNNANVRIQGPEGRYTQVLRDGMPLYDGFSGGFGILSIPPLDLKQVELIKGAASTLYGGGAIGGLVNIISRKPSEKAVRTFTLNRSTLRESNVNAYLSKKYAKTGYTFYSGYTNQAATDVNKDGFSDLSQLSSFVVHPRFFLYPSSKTTLTLGYTGTFEKRKGGDMTVLGEGANGVHQFFEDNHSIRHSAELLFEQKLGEKSKLEFKNSYSLFNRNQTSNIFGLEGRQSSNFSELSYYHPYTKGSWVAGINYSGDLFKKINSSFPIQLKDFTHTTLGFFAQNTFNVSEKTIVEAGIREDLHNVYGNFLLPRVALFHRWNEAWAGRAGIGYGYKIPNALSSQITELPLQMIMPFSNQIKAEKSIGYNAEINYKKVWDNGNEFFINHAFFLTQVNQPIFYTKDPAWGSISFSNAEKPVLTKGFDTYVQMMMHEWEIYVGYTYTIAERKYLTTNSFMPLTPKNRMAFTLVRSWEAPGFMMGVEASYTGSQNRYDGSKTPGYVFAAAMIRKSLGEKIRLVLNCENLFDYRQSRVESLYSGLISNPDFAPLWAPTDGRVINLSLYLSL